MKNFNAPKERDGFLVLVFFDRKLDSAAQASPTGTVQGQSDKTGSLASEFSFPDREEANPKNQNNREKTVGKPSPATFFGPDSENQ